MSFLDYKVKVCPACERPRRKWKAVSIVHVGDARSLVYFCRCGQRYTALEWAHLPVEVLTDWEVRRLQKKEDALAKGRGEEGSAVASAVQRREPLDPLRLVVAGSRSFAHLGPRHIDLLIEALDLEPSLIIEGGCPSGADNAARLWAELMGVPHQRVAADWDTHGRAAGPMRNREMAQMADALLLIWDGESRGSRSMLREANEAGLTIYEVRR